MEKKLFVFDMDGTLLNNKGEINPKTIITFEQLISLGHYIAIATGRSYDQIKHYQKIFEIASYVATINGGLITDTKNKINLMIAKPLNKELVLYMYELSKRINREFQINNDFGFHRIYFGKNPIDEVDDSNFFHGEEKKINYISPSEMEKEMAAPIYHLSIKCENAIIKKEINDIRDKWEKNSLCQVTQTSTCFIDVDSIGVNKYAAIKYFQDKLNIDNKNTYAFGDSLNDKEMIINCGFGVAMGNSVKELIEYADIVIGDNNTDTISEFLLQVIKDE